MLKIFILYNSNDIELCQIRQVEMLNSANQVTRLGIPQQTNKAACPTFTARQAA